jgi:hypothetical protein
MIEDFGHGLELSARRLCSEVVYLLGAPEPLREREVARLVHVNGARAVDAQEVAQSLLLGALLEKAEKALDDRVHGHGAPRVDGKRKLDLENARSPKRRAPPRASPLDSVARYGPT